VRGKRSALGGRRSGRGGAPWWRGSRGGVLAEEDDGGEHPLPGFVSRRRRQVLSVGGAQ
jgi:hypothetical protein